jgi:hypothetical protein
VTRRERGKDNLGYVLEYACGKISALSKKPASSCPRQEVQASFCIGDASHISRKTPERSFMKKSWRILSMMTTLAGAASLAFAGYVLLTALPDVRRYIRISTM